LNAKMPTLRYSGFGFDKLLALVKFYCSMEHRSRRVSALVCLYSQLLNQAKSRQVELSWVC